MFLSVVYSHSLLVITWSYGIVYSVYFHLVYYHVLIIACHFISLSYISVFVINCSICCISQILKFRLDLIPYPQSWQTQQISGRKFGKNEEIFGIWEEISWLATDNCSPQRAVQSLGIERKFFLSKWLKIRAIFNFNLSNVLNPKYYRVSNQLLWTFSIDILLV